MTVSNKSIYNDIQDVKAKLDSISPSMCMAKWLQVSLHLPQGLTQSCYHPPTHSIDINEIKINPNALHNTNKKISERRQMRQGIRPKGCQYCWNLEDGGHNSDRHYRSSEPWAQRAWEEVAKPEKDHNINPRYVEVNFNQSCNFKCTYCSPHLSTTWEKEIKKFGPLKIGKATHNDIDSLAEQGLMPIASANKENPYVQAFWKWWPELYQTIEVFRMTGGEPLMDKNTFRVLDYVNHNPNTKLELSITSNMCPPNQELFSKFITKVKDIEGGLTPSLFKSWKQNGYLKEVLYYAENNGHWNWKEWPRYIVESKDDDNDEIDSKTKRVSFDEINLKQRKTPLQANHMRDETTGDFLYNLIWYKPVNQKTWTCLGSEEWNESGNSGIFLDTNKLKSLMLFVSVDAVGERAEYIRTGLDWNRFSDNVKTFLSETKNTELSFINTFNFFSITSLKDFLKFVLELRLQYAGEEDHQSRIWFDIPYLRDPKWMSAQIAVNFPSLITIIENCVKFMQRNKQSTTKIGFHQYEIDKVIRLIEWIKSAEQYVKEDSNIQNQIICYDYFTQIDERRNTNIREVFPELEDVWNYFEYLKDLHQEL